jgi:hypothetical protein
MNKLTLSGATDFALTTDALAFMQSSYEALERIANLGGENIIVSGCTVSGSTATSGWMFLKGKLMPFQGGTIQTTVRIIEEVNTVTVDVASRQQTTYRAEFGSLPDTTKNVPWADIKRPPSLVDLIVTEEDLALLNGFAIYTYDPGGYAKLKKQGNLRILNIHGLKVDGGTSEKFAELSSADRPALDVYFSLFQDGGEAGYFFNDGASTPNQLPPQIIGGVLANGDLRIGHVNQSISFSGNIMWTV